MPHIVLLSTLRRSQRSERLRSRWTAPFLLSVIGFVASPASLRAQPDAPPATHATEIKAFAAFMAIARTAAQQCPGIVIDESVAEGERRRLHILDVDYFVFRVEAREYVDALTPEISTLPGLARWCADALQRYGPHGMDEAKGALVLSYPR